MKFSKVCLSPLDTNEVAGFAEVVFVLGTFVFEDLTIYEWQPLGARYVWQLSSLSGCESGSRALL